MQKSKNIFQREIVANINIAETEMIKIEEKTTVKHNKYKNVIIG